MPRYALLLVLGVASAAYAGDSGPADKAAAPKHVLTTQQIAAYRNQLARILAKKAVPVKVTGEGQAVHLAGYGFVALARMENGGSIGRLCTDDADEALAFLSGSSAPRAVEK